MKKDEEHKQRLNDFKLSEAYKAGKSKTDNLKSFLNRTTKKKKEKSSGLKKSKSADERSDEPRKTLLEKLKSTFSCCKRKKIKNNPTLKKFNYGIKRSKNDIKKLDKSLRPYIKQKLKWVTFFILIYVIIFVAIISISISVNHLEPLSVVSQNKTKQERFISSKVQVDLFTYL